MDLYIRYFKIQLQSAMEYKKSFVLTTIGQAMTTVFSLVAIYCLFDRFGNIKGYTFNEIMICFSSIYLSFSIAECLGRGFDRFSVIISNGEFDRIMLRPRNEILQILGTKIEFSRIGRLLQAMITMIYAIATANIAWDIRRVITLILMNLSGIVLFISLFMIYAAFCFYTIEGLEFMNIFTDGGRELAQYPLNIYGKSILKFFTYIVPLAFVNYYPFLYIIGRIEIYKWYYMLSPLIACIFIIPSFIFWKIGVKHYKSIGA